MQCFFLRASHIYVFSWSGLDPWLNWFDIWDEVFALMVNSPFRTWLSHIRLHWLSVTQPISCFLYDYLTCLFFIHSSSYWCLANDRHIWWNRWLLWELLDIRLILLVSLEGLTLSLGINLKWALSVFVYSPACLLFLLVQETNDYVEIFVHVWSYITSYSNVLFWI